MQKKFFWLRFLRHWSGCFLATVLPVLGVTFGIIFVSRLDDLKTQIDFKIDDLKTKIDFKIDDLKTKIDFIDLKIGDLETKVDMKIGDLESKVDMKIGDLESKIDLKIGDLESKIDMKIGDLETVISGKRASAASTKSSIMLTDANGTPKGSGTLFFYDGSWMVGTAAHVFIDKINRLKYPNNTIYWKPFLDESQDQIRMVELHQSDVRICNPLGCDFAIWKPDSSVFGERRKKNAAVLGSHGPQLHDSLFGVCALSHSSSSAGLALEGTVWSVTDKSCLDHGINNGCILARTLQLSGCSGAGMFSRQGELVTFAYGVSELVGATTPQTSIGQVMDVSVERLDLGAKSIAGAKSNLKKICAWNETKTEDGYGKCLNQAITTMELFSRLEPVTLMVLHDHIRDTIYGGVRLTQFEDK